MTSPGIIVGDVLFWLGVFVAVVLAIDFFLRERERRLAKAWAEAAWVRLDDQRWGKVRFFLISDPVQRVVALSSALLLAVGATVKNRVFFLEILFGLWRRESLDDWVALLGLAIIVLPLSAAFWAIHRRVAAWLGRSKNPRLYLLRLLAGMVGAWTCAFLLSWPASLVDDVEGWAAVPMLPVFVLVGAIVLEAGALQLTFILALWLFIIVWLVSAALWLLRFLLLRIAEHPKGPVFALAVLVALLGKVLKAIFASGP